MKTFLKSKIHHARVTDKNVDYIGSIFIDKKLLDLSGISEYEKVDVINVDNGQRWQTYVGFGEEGSGTILVNGGGAYLCEVGHRLIILAYEMTDKLKEKPKMILVDKSNNFLNYL
ncbi:aspartate 1-decarboxylase [Candidatus Kuenenbacteria bacterium]|nr:aspartate 1-decarboxylase [Candidatus Kuenenbacteria bacterium]